MLFLAFTIIAVVLTVLAFINKNVGLSIIAALAWVGTGIYQLSNYYTGTGILLEYITGYLGFLMFVCMIIAPIMWIRKPKPVALTPQEKADMEWKNDFGEIEEIHKTKKAMRNLRRGR